MRRELIGIILVAVVSMSFFATNMGVAQQEGEEKRTISVSGVYAISVDPDKAEVTIGVENQETTAQLSQQQNAKLIEKIKSTLLANGISKTDIETSYYSVYPVKTYPRACYEGDCDNEPRITSYRTTHLLKVTVRDIDKVGKCIDLAVNAGANKVNQISFGLSDEKRDTLYNDALAEAARNARIKADAIADGLGVRVTDIVSASEGYVSVTPIYRSLSASEASYDTDISPGEVSVSASVSVVYEF
jgi:uncharacterized protein YggE